MKLSEKYIIRQIAGETVILSGENDGFNGVMLTSEVGSRILELLQEGADSEAAIVASLLEEYEVEEALLAEDVRAFLSELLESGILI